MTNDELSGSVAETQLTRNPHLTIVRCTDDEILVRHGARSLHSRVLKDESRLHLLGPLVDAFIAPASLRELRDRGIVAGERYEAAVAMVRSLVDAQVLVPPTMSIAGLYLSTLFADGVVELHQKTVAVAGAGTLGGLIIDDLVAAGVGTVRVLDHRTDADGTPLVQCLSRSAWESGQSAVTAIDARHDDVSAPGVVEAFLDACDAGVVAWEAFSPSLFHEVNESALRVGVPWTLVFVDGSEVVVGPTVVPGETACYLEYEIEMEASLTQRDAYDHYQEKLEEATSAQPHYVLPPCAKVGAGLASACILRHLTSGISPVLNRVMRVDLERFTIDSQEVLRLPRCPACGTQRSVTGSSSLDVLRRYAPSSGDIDGS